LSSGASEAAGCTGEPVGVSRRIFDLSSEKNPAAYADRLAFPIVALGAVMLFSR